MTPTYDGNATLRRLAAMVLLQAVEDARDGDLGAARWLLEDGMELALELGISCNRVLLFVDSLGGKESCLTTGTTASTAPHRKPCP